MSVISFVHSPWPDCTVQIMSYDDAAPDFPGTHGSGFFVQIFGRVFLLTARHCIGKVGDDLAEVANRLMIPIETPLGGRTLRAKDYVRFGNVGRVMVTENLDLFVGDKQGDLDIVALEVAEHSTNVIAALLQRCVSLPPNGQWFENTLALFARDKKRSILRAKGFPTYGTESEVDYDKKRIVSQGVMLLGVECGHGPYPHTRTMRFVDGSPISDADGLSGGPVYMRVSGEGSERFALVGMMLNGTFPVAHFATVECLTAAIQKCIT